VLLILAQWLTGEGVSLLVRRMLATTFASLALLGLMSIEPLWGRASAGTLLLVLTLWLGWSVVLDAEQRNGFVNIVRKRLKRGPVDEHELPTGSDPF
jgi:O-antigen ligase